MVNILPPRAKKKIKNEYRLRVIVVWSLIFSVSGLILIILTIPTHLLLNENTEAFSKDIKNLEKETNNYKKLVEELNLANQRLDYISKNTYDQDLNNLINSITSSAPDGVRLTNIDTDFSGKEYEPVSISGIAENRTTLSTFRDNLNNKDIFDEVRLPIEDLAGDDDLTFTMTLNLSQN